MFELVAIFAIAVVVGAVFMSAVIYFTGKA